MYQRLFEILPPNRVLNVVPISRAVDFKRRNFFAERIGNLFPHTVRNRRRRKHNQFLADDPRRENFMHRFVLIDVIQGFGEQIEIQISELEIDLSICC